MEEVFVDESGDFSLDLGSNGLFSFQSGDGALVMVFLLRISFFLTENEIQILNEALVSDDLEKVGNIELVSDGWLAYFSLMEDVCADSWLCVLGEMISCWERMLFRVKRMGLEEFSLVSS
ncbi:hypothetical protein [Pseudomonas sp. P97.38]|uniref:hypothetical protein n=1 Tax=Pseudomonas sp. P97.38 TaxID=255451 RepID=UPI00069ECCB2|nr:hypothetical protein [Pseudomonas sp. P97.38]